MSIPYTLPKEFEELFQASKTAPIKRVQIYQQSEQSGNIQPNQLIRFNIPADCIADFRDSQVLVDLALTNVVPQTPDVITWTGTVGATGTFQFEYKGYQSGPVNGVTNIPIATTQGTVPLPPPAPQATLADYLLTIPTFKYDFGVYDRDTFNQIFTLVNNFTSGGNTIVLTNNSAERKFVNQDIANYVKIVNLNLSAGSLPANIVNGTVAFPRLEFGSGSIVDRIQVEFNSETFCEIENYNRLWQIISKMKLVDHRRCSGTLLYNEGLYSESYFFGYRRLAIPLYGVGILNNIMPLSLIPGLQLRITIRLADPHIALTNGPGANGTQSYQVQNCEFHYHSFIVDKSIENKLAERLASGGITYGFENYLSFSDTLSGTTSDKILNFNVHSFLGVLGIMQQQDFLGDWTKYYKTSSFIRNNIQSYRLKVGTSDYYPKNTVQTLQQILTNPYSDPDVVQPFIELMRFFGIYRPLDIDPNVNDEAVVALGYYSNYHDRLYLDSYIQDRLNVPSFIMAISTDAEARDVEKSYHQMSSGVDISGQTSVTLELRNYQLQGANTLYVFGKFQAACILTKFGAQYVK